MLDAVGYEGERLSGTVRGEGVGMVVQLTGCPGGAVMSVGDSEIEDPSEFCPCGNYARIGKRTCYECDLEFADLYADMKIQDAKEGK